MKPFIYNVRDPTSPRPLLYAYKDPKEAHCYWFHGVCYADFQAALTLRSTLVLLADGHLDIDDEDRVTHFNYVEPEKLSQLAGQNIYSACGDFIWIDTPSITNLRRVSPDDLAALLYMRHTFKPLRSPFFRTLKNRFAYLAHDDGYVLILYTRHPSDIAQLLEAVIAVKTRKFLNTRIPTKGIGRRLLRLARKGVLLDFRPEPGPACIRISHPGRFGRFKGMGPLLHKLESSPLAPVAVLTCKGWEVRAGPSLKGLNIKKLRDEGRP